MKNTFSARFNIRLLIDVIKDLRIKVSSVPVKRQNNTNFSLIINYYHQKQSASDMSSVLLTMVFYLRVNCKLYFLSYCNEYADFSILHVCIANRPIQNQIIENLEVMSNACKTIFLHFKEMFVVEMMGRLKMRDLKMRDGQKCRGGKCGTIKYGKLFGYYVCKRYLNAVPT